MVACEINKNSSRYQALKQMSGISEFILDNTISRYKNEFNREDVELDELPGVNSIPHLKKSLNIKELPNINSIDTDQVLEYTSTNSIPEANIQLNKQYKDLEITLTQFDTFTSIEYKKRPRVEGKISPEIDQELDSNPNKSRVLIVNQLSKLSKLYGINIIPTTTSEAKVPNAGVVKGYVQDGNIYINTDNATIDTPIHEMMHIFLGGVRYTNPQLYFSLVNTVETLPNYQEYSLQFPFKTRGDLNEEIFVQEFAHYLTNQPSLFDNLDISNMSKLTYEVLRNIDSFIFGEYSIKTLDDNIFGSSIIELSKSLQSDIINNKQYGSLSPDMIHRILSNYKEDLKKQNLLEERCNG